MYVPRPNAVDEPAARAMVEAYGAGELITVGADGYPLATLLPVLWESDRVVAHFARANPQWRQIHPDTPALLVVGGPQAYVSPSWYAAKAEHGRVVPTWNYSSVHLTGRARVVDDAAWLRRVVTALTDRHEARRDDPWRVGDAPADYVEGMLKAIVGVELVVERVEGKAKLSQNRSAADRAGVVAGLGEEHPVARAMRERDGRVEP
ncbi:MAG TPA: FMN-binding negative transcriptional regulator [Nocardioides sp.]|nr:FMN-binding negative transcriptional regulator [Nocardioides sp.]